MSSAVGSEKELQLKLQGLQHEVEKGKARVKRLAILATLLVALLILLLIAIHLYNVMQYAAVSSVEAVAVAELPGAAELRYKPESAGKIEFVRESKGLVQTLTEYANAPGTPGESKGKFVWSGRADEESTLRVTYRSGLFLTTRDLPISKR